MSRAVIRAGILAVVLGGAIGCDNGKPGQQGGPAGAVGAAAASSDPRAAVVAAWKQGGLEPSVMTAAKAFGDDCQSGTVGTIDVVLCTYATAADAKAAEEQALAWVGEATGAARASGAVLIGVADRRKSDPSGRTINQMLKLAPP